MSKTNNVTETIKSQIQKIGLDKPSSDFTDVIMKEIAAGPENEVSDNLLLKSLLHHSLEKPPADFAQRIMSQVKAHDFKTEFKPVISGKTWGAIVLATTALSIWRLFSDQAASESPLGLTPFFVDLGDKLNNIFTSVPSLYLITFFALSALLLTDHFLNRYKNATNKSQIYRAP